MGGPACREAPQRIGLAVICLDSLLVVQGIASKAQKWRRRNWQGSGWPISHVDLWKQLLDEVEAQGSSMQWLHVPSHIGVCRNENADLVRYVWHAQEGLPCCLLPQRQRRQGGYLGLRLLRPPPTEARPLDQIPRLTVIHCRHIQNCSECRDISLQEW